MAKTEIPRELLQQLPKTDLHCHLDGSLRLDTVLEELAHRERVVFFEIAPNPTASREVRARAAEGLPLDGLVPPEVARLIRERGLYRRD